MANKILLKRETWNHKHVWVVRSSGKIQTWRFYKGSRLTKSKAQELYKNNFTLHEDKFKKTTKLTNFNEISTVTSTTIANRGNNLISSPPSGKVIQYVVEGLYKGVVVSARSARVGSKLVNNHNQAKEDAWDNFLGLLSYKAFNVSDEAEGIKVLGKVTNLREGWVVYRSK